MLKKILSLIFPMFLCTILALGQSNSHSAVFISGSIEDQNHEPIAGASIYAEHDFKIGTSSDRDGKFYLKVKLGTPLIISFTGMNIVHVKAAKKMHIVLKASPEALKATVVTGYQEIKKDRMTGSIATVTAKDIKDLGISSMDQALAGRVSGLNAVSSGAPGANARILIRGVNSLSGNTDPIWIVDGMPLQGEVPNLSSAGGQISSRLFESGIGNISPDDIESITVLKDAAACAIYGARAANGVIVVKTKSGHEGVSRLNISAYMSYRERPEPNLHMMNSAQKLLFEEQIYNTTGSPSYGRAAKLLRDADYGLITKEAAREKIAELAKINTNWFKELYKPSVSKQFNASLSGGTKKTQYYNSLNYTDEKGIEINSGYKRMRFSSKLNHNISKNLILESELAATYRANSSSASAINSLNYAIHANPYEKPNAYDESWNTQNSSIRPGLLWPKLNVINDLKNNINTTRYLEASLLANLRYTPFKSLELKSSFIVAGSNNNIRTINGANTFTNYSYNWLNFLGHELPLDDAKGALYEGSTYQNSYTLRNTIEFNKNIEENHFINIFAGNEVSASESYVSFNYSPIFDQKHRIIGFPTLKDGTDVKNIDFNRLGGTSKLQSRFVSFFLSGTYSYKDKYILNSSVRYDGSDIIGNKNQFSPLWNVSARYNINKEKFFKLDFVDNLALKLGFGYTGSIDKNALPFVLMYLDQNILYDNQNIPTSFRYANPNIKWQTKRDFNIGFESSFFQNRLWFNMNYYNNLVFNLLDQKALPWSSGRNSVKENVADVRNRGIEIDFGFDIIRSSDLVWNIRANFAYNQNKILNTYYKSLKDFGNVYAGDWANIYVENYPVNAWYGYRFDKVDPRTGHVIIKGDDNKPFDINKAQDETLGLKIPTPVYLGQYVPPITGGFSTSVNYKRFIFSMNFVYMGGHKISSFNSFRPLSSHNRYYTDQYRWRAPGDITDYPPISLTNSYYAQYKYDRNLESGDYLRNTYTSLAYNFKPELAHSMNLQFLRLTFSIANAFTITNYKGIDPALMGAISYPNTRIYSLALNVGF